MPEYNIDTQLHDVLLDQWFDSVKFFEQDEEGNIVSQTTIYSEKGVRYVRTPEGARHYGQPIGTPIRTDLNVPHMPDVSSDAQSLGLSTSAPDETPIEVLPAVTNPASDITSKGRWRGQDVEVSWSSTEGEAHAYYGESYRVDVHRSRTGTDGYTWSIAVNGYSGMTRGWETVESGSEKDADKARKAAEKALADRVAYYQHRPGRDYDNLIELHPGTYGLDYELDGSTPDEDRYVNDNLYRAKKIEEHMARYGIVAENTESNAGMDMIAYEQIMAVLEAHEEWFPGFASTFHSIGLTGEQGGGVLAYNGLRMGDWKSVLRFSDKHFQDVDRYVTQYKAPAWFSGDVSETIDAYGYSEDTDRGMVSALYTITHEVGHSVGRVCLGLGNEVVDDLAGVSDREARAMFAEGLYDILNDFDIYDRPYDEDGFLDVISQNMSAGNAARARFTKFDVAVMSEVLSVYGASSLHEMLAETWAEYLLDPDPREFAIRIGKLMEDVVSDFYARKA